MTLHNSDSTTLDRDEAFIAKDMDLEDTDLLLAEEDETPKSSTTSRTHERIIDDKYSKTLDATQIYLNEIGFSPLLSAEEEVYFARKALKGDVASRKRMIE